MLDFLLRHENIIRLLLVLLVFTAMALWECAAPRRRQGIPRLLRWSNNLALVSVDTLILRLVFPVLAVGFAQGAQGHGWGIFNLINAPSWLEFILALLLLDLALYWQHMAFHAAPLLWRVHRVHHADLELDVSSGLRFHPLEILLSMVFKLAVIALTGASAAPVLVFEILLSASSLFNHSNVRMPVAIEKTLRNIIVTPDMHRVHHSIHAVESNSNYGFNLSCWDKLFGTYTSRPRDGQLRMRLGVNNFRSERDLWLHRMLLQPFARRADTSAHSAKHEEQ